MKILVTGGCGFIGSHTCCELLEHNYEVVIIDNLSHSQEDVVDKIKTITNKNLKFYKGDLRDKELVDKIFRQENIDAVIHLASLKVVSESVKKPILYYQNNIESTLTLLEIMTKYKCKKLIFSSSATIYGNPEKLPIKENFSLHATNPYSSTKLYIEGILKDLYNSDNEWAIAVLRFFNPIGSHKSYLIGENPQDIPDNLMSYIVGVATGKLDLLNVFGDDYNTKDGTGVRDYIHVVDLAVGHLKAIELINQTSGIDFYNLGTGNEYSVLEIINAFEKVNNVKIKYIMTARRPGDIEAFYADCTHAKEKLNFEATKGLEEMVRDSYEYAKRNS